MIKRNIEHLKTRENRFGYNKQFIGGRIGIYSRMAVDLPEMN